MPEGYSSARTTIRSPGSMLRLRAATAKPYDVAGISATPSASVPITLPNSSRSRSTSENQSAGSIVHGLSAPVECFLAGSAY